MYSLSVVKEVMGEVITNVTKDAAAIYSYCCIPIVPEYSVGKLVEGSGKNNEQRWRHDQAQFIHGQIVVDAVQEEMESDADAVVWKVTMHV
jgi:hypothetical protein